MIELRHFLNVMNELKLIIINSNVVAKKSIKLLSLSHLTRNDAFDGWSENVIAEVNAIDAYVKSIESNQHIKCKLFTLKHKKFGRYRRWLRNK